MTWVSKPHRCPKPGPDERAVERAGLGSVWRCDDCGREYTWGLLGWYVAKAEPTS